MIHQKSLNGSARIAAPTPRSSFSVTASSWVLLACLAVPLTGCYTPLHSFAVPAIELSDQYRMPDRSIAPTLNLAKLTVAPPVDYILGPNDTLEITVPDLFPNAEIRPIRSRIMADNTVTLPLIEKITVGGMNLSDAQDAINREYADGFFANPRVSVALAEKFAISVSVIGEVTTPGVYALPRYENDVGHALALAGGFREFAAEVVEVHRRMSRHEFETRILANADKVDKTSSALKPAARLSASRENTAGKETKHATKPAAQASVVAAANTNRKTPKSSRPIARLSTAVESDGSAHRAEQVKSCRPVAASAANPPAFARCTDSTPGNKPDAKIVRAAAFLNPIEPASLLQADVDGGDPFHGGQPLGGRQMFHGGGAVDGGGAGDDEIEIVLRIPLRGGQVTVRWDGMTFVRQDLTPADVTLNSGDVVVIPRQEDEVFFVVGPLDRTNVVNFTVRARDRELGNAFLIPPDRDIDVITAVAMAGYIDPINSPDTVTVQRQVPGCSPLLIKVNLIDARYDWHENLYVQPGDILYLNPDCPWWFRRTFDRIVPDILLAPYFEYIFFWIPD